MWVVSKVG